MTTAQPLDAGLKVRLTEAERATLESERVRRGARSWSAVVRELIAEAKAKPKGAS